MGFNSSYAQEVFYLHAIKISDSEVENFEKNRIEKRTSFLRQGYCEFINPFDEETAIKKDILEIALIFSFSTLKKNTMYNI